MARLAGVAGHLDFTLEKGATFRLSLTWQDSNGNPIDLSGYTGRLQIRDRLDSTSVLTELTTENGGLTLGGSAGTIKLFISSAVTEVLSYSRGLYHLELEDAQGEVTRLLQGSVVVHSEVTR